MRNRDTRWIDAIAVIVLMSFPAVTSARVTEIALNGLVARSDLIVLAKVRKVEDGPADIKAECDQFPPVKVATAQVIETWKGSPVREIRYVASPLWTCDISDAEKGERVVLFLGIRKGSPIMMIAHSGWGRMPLCEVKDKTYATLADRLILPEGTPTISEEKAARFTLPFTEPGKPAPQPLTFAYSVRSIELRVLRELVKSKLPPNKVGPLDQTRRRQLGDERRSARVGAALQAEGHRS